MLCIFDAFFIHLIFSEAEGQELSQVQVKVKKTLLSRVFILINISWRFKIMALLYIIWRIIIL